MGKFFSKYGIQFIGICFVMGLLAFIVGFIAFGDPSRDFLPVSKLITGIAIQIYNVAGNTPSEADGAAE